MERERERERSDHEYKFKDSACSYIDYRDSEMKAYGKAHFPEDEIDPYSGAISSVSALDGRLHVSTAYYHIQHASILDST